ncbi:polyprotein [Phytophthora megakarya]|uniref:Polyprotein n=1 Tax=Phytophthora megakarya TaxID=4795 RepID=A0A225W3Y4_9STRA|nr:polyprotein [Phytophthora megakarya]
MKGKRTKGWLTEGIAYSDADFCGEQGRLLCGVVTLDGIPVSWIRKILDWGFAVGYESRNELGVKPKVQMLLHVDNQAALKRLNGESVSAKSKHVNIKLTFVGSYNRKGTLQPEYLENQAMLADLMTKVLDASRLANLRTVGLL